MKKLLLVLCLYFIALGVSIAQVQVYNGNITLSKQSDVNAFKWTEVTGAILINGNSSNTGVDRITNLSPLSKLTTVGGDFQIANTDETDLNDLVSLKTVGGSLTILQNSKILNITLSNLISVGTITCNGSDRGDGSGSAITQFISLPLLTSVNGDCAINYFSAMTDVNIPRLSTVKGTLRFQGNKLLTRFNFSPVSLGGLVVHDNSSLSDCCVLKQLLNTLAIKTTPVFGNNLANCNSSAEILNAPCLSATNNALTFDGVDDVVEFGSPNFHSNSFTIEGWIKPQKSGAIFNVYQGQNTAIYAEITNANTVRFVIRSPVANSGGIDIIGTKNVVADGQWHHFAAVKADDDYAYLYIDGMPDGKTQGKIKDFSTTPDKMRLGMNVTNGPRYYKGSMDEIRFWNVARTPSDIQANRNKSLSGTEQGLAVYYKFNQGTANGDNKTVTTLTDTKGALNGNLQKFTLSGTTSNFTTGAPVQ